MRLLSPAGWKCFEMDRRRYWDARRLGIAAAALVGVLLLQAAVSYLISRPAGPRTGGWLWAWQVAAQVGLLSPLPNLFSGSWGVVGVSGQPIWAIPWMLLSSVLTAAHFFLLPAFMAMSVAADRQQRRLHELTLTGLKPAEILLAKGLAGGFPFLLVTLVWSVIEPLGFFLVVLPGLDTPGQSLPMRQILVGTSPLSVYFTAAAMLLRSVTAPLTLAALAGILVCISALCRRVPTALLCCYATVMLKNVLLGGIPGSVGQMLFPVEPGLRSIVTILFWLGLHLAVLRLLVPYALKAVEYPDDQVSIPHPAGNPLAL